MVPEAHVLPPPDQDPPPHAHLDQEVLAAQAEAQAEDHHHQAAQCSEDQATITTLALLSSLMGTVDTTTHMEISAPMDVQLPQMVNKQDAVLTKNAELISTGPHSFSS